jgi:predicted nucleic acid-binding protein
VILTDTSVWIDFLRETGSAGHLELKHRITDGDPIAVPDPVFMELLAGTTDEERAAELTAFLSAFHNVHVEGPLDFHEAAAIQRACRRHGHPVRSLIDCLIAAVALRVGLPILAAHRDFEVIARHTGLELVRP